MKQFGAFLPMSESGVLQARDRRDDIDKIVKDFVLLLDPDAVDITVTFNIWDDQDPGGQEMARRQFGLPHGTKGTMGFKCFTPNLGRVTA